MKKVIITAFSLLVINLCTAQTSLNAGGGDFENGVVTLSYSIGQVFYETDVINEGVQLPYNILEVSRIEDLDGIFLNIIAYPNPTRDFLELRIENEGFDFKTAKYNITDIKGNTVKTGTVNTELSRISVEELPKGTYLMEILDRSKSIKVFKVIKN
jgi:hypothetical protein